MEKVITESKIEKDKLNTIILLGDSFKIKKLKFLIQQKYEDCKIISDLDDAVALGAGIYSAKLSDKINIEKLKKLKIYEITPLTLGIRTEGDLMNVILPRGTKIPVKCVKSFVTTQDYQTKIKFEIYEGERKLIRDNKRLGGMVLNNLPEDLKGKIKVNVTFSVDVDGLLKVNAEERSQGVYKDLKEEIHIGNMNQEEINKKIKEAEKLFKDDKIEEERIKAMLHLNDLLVNYSHKYGENEEIRRNIDQYRNWLKHSSQVPKEEYIEKINELIKIMPKDDNEYGMMKKKYEENNNKDKRIESSEMTSVENKNVSSDVNGNGNIENSSGDINNNNIGNNSNENEENMIMQQNIYYNNMDNNNMNIQQNNEDNQQEQPIDEAELIAQQEMGDQPIDVES